MVGDESTDKFPQVIRCTSRAPLFLSVCAEATPPPDGAVPPADGCQNGTFPWDSVFKLHLLYLPWYYVGKLYPLYVPWDYVSEFHLLHMPWDYVRTYIRVYIASAVIFDPACAPWDAAGQPCGPTGLGSQRHSKSAPLPINPVGAAQRTEARRPGCVGALEFMQTSGPDSHRVRALSF